MGNHINPKEVQSGPGRKRKKMFLLLEQFLSNTLSHICFIFSEWVEFLLKNYRFRVLGKGRRSLITLTKKKKKTEPR